MASSFSRKSVSRTVVCLAFGAMAAQRIGICGPHQTNAWAQEPVAGTPVEKDTSVLHNATESQVKELWSKLQGDCAELEATDPRAAITRYQKFFEQGAGRFPSVGVQIALRIARLWQIDLKDYDKAIEIYDWALGLYRNQPEAVQLQQGRLAAEQTQQRAEAAQGGKTPGAPQVPGTVPLAGTTPLAVIAPLAVPVPQSPNSGRLGISVPLPGGLGPPSSANGGGLGVGISAPGNSKSLIVAIPRVVAAAPHVAVAGNALGWKPGPERCVTALAQGPQGTLWVATEDSGVWRYNASAALVQNRWHQFTAKDGLGDDSAYALAVDQKGRVWAGTLNHGVSVWNGKSWKNYGVPNGPLGERVFAIKTCPTDGDVWIATDAGLTRYSAKNDSWSHITRGDGLPSDQIQAIAFDKVGNVLLGTQCDGVAMALAADGYKTWRVVTGPNEMPVTATGKGLPSSLINDVMVAKDGTFYAATTTGLAWSSDGDQGWTYVRGLDYADKVRGLYSGPPAGWKEEPGALLAEDYVSCLSQDEAGHLWIGHWQAGSEMVQMQSGPGGLRVKAVSHHQDSGLVRALLLRSNGALLLARYDEGLSYGSSSAAHGNATTKNAVAGAIPASAPLFPSTAKAPTLAELNALLASLGHIEPLDSKAPFVTALADDWTTQGDWLGRYGRYWASLCAMVSPNNYLWGGGWTPVDSAFQVSPKEKEDSLRFYVSWVQTNNPRSLEMPPTYLDSRLQRGLTTRDQNRRQAELDDHGEEYPLSKEGPDIYCSVNIPPGLWTLSFYNHNKDGHDGLNRMRDYRYSIRSHDPAQPLADVSGFDAQPELAHSRERDFAGGVYKRFLVRGPQQLTVRMARNNSRNTILAGAFLDLVDERPAPYFGSLAWWQKRQSAREQERDELSAQNAGERASRFAPATSEKDAATRLFLEVERLRELNPPQWVRGSRPVYAALARWMDAAQSRQGASQDPVLLARLGTCLYNLGRYAQWEGVQKKQGLHSARDIEKSLKWDGHSSDGTGFQTISEQEPQARLDPG